MIHMLERCRSVLTGEQKWADWSSNYTRAHTPGYIMWVYGGDGSINDDTNE